VLSVIVRSNSGAMLHGYSLPQSATKQADLITHVTWNYCKKCECLRLTHIVINTIIWGDKTLLSQDRGCHTHLSRLRHHSQTALESYIPQNLRLRIK